MLTSRQHSHFRLSRHGGADLQLYWRTSGGLTALYQTPELAEDYDEAGFKHYLIKELGQIRGTGADDSDRVRVEAGAGGRDIPTVPTGWRGSVEEAVAQTGEIGLRSSSKLTSETIPTRPDVGGVRLDLSICR